MEKVVTKSFPTVAQLGELERIWIVDNVVGESPLGDGEMAVLAVGETENGYTFRTGSDGALYRGGGNFSPIFVYSAADRYSKFGRLGFTKETGPSQGAVARRSGGNVAWNGNLYVLESGWKFNRYIICRVDNSAGTVTFRRHAAIKGGKGTFDLEPGDTVTFQRNGVTNVVITFNAAVATIVGVGGTFPTLFTGGETLVIQVDDDAPKTIIFTSAEQSLANVVDYINDVMAATVASTSGGQLALSSVIRGKAGRIQVLGGTSLATLGHVDTPIADQWTFTVTNVTAGLYRIRYQAYVDGALTNFDATYTAGGGETTTQLRDLLLTNGGSTGFNDITNADGVTPAAGAGATLTITGSDNVQIVAASVVTEPAPGDITVAHNQVGQFTDMYGSGNVNNIDEVTAAEAAVLIDAGANLGAYVDSDGYLWAADTGTPISGTLQATAGVYESLGFDGELASAGSGAKVTIPAGTRVEDSTTGVTWCTLEDYETETTGGGFDLKVRPWEDLDTAIASASSGIDTVTDMPLGFWSVTNASSVTRLSKTQLDLRYKEALERTLDANSPAAVARIVISARSSANIDSYLLQNVKDASAAGMLAPRRAIFGPPVGTAISTAISDAGLGVGYNRDDRRIYTFPGIRKLVPEIATATSSNGVGFNDSGIVETPAVALYAFMRARLPAEKSCGENPLYNEIGSLNGYGFQGIESAYDATLGGSSLVSPNYVQFKALGITAITKVPGQGYLFQSDLSSVDPDLDKARSPASRGFLVDEVAIGLWKVGVPYKDTLTSPANVQGLLSEVESYLARLKAEGQPDRQRIYDFAVALESSEDDLKNGFLILKVEVQRFAHTKAIVYNLNLKPAAINVSEAA